MENGAGNGDYDMSNVDECVHDSHTTIRADVDYNDVNVLRCVLGEDGECLRTCLEDEFGRDEPIFAGNFDYDVDASVEVADSDLEAASGSE